MTACATRRRHQRKEAQCLYQCVARALLTPTSGGGQIRSNVNIDDTASVRRTLQTIQQRVQISAKYFVIFLYDIISVMTHDLICYVLFFCAIFVVTTYA